MIHVTLLFCLNLPIWKTRSLSPPLWKSSLEVSGSRHWERSQKPMWAPKELGPGLSCDIPADLCVTDAPGWVWAPGKTANAGETRSLLSLSYFLSYTTCKSGPQPQRVPDTHLLLLTIKMDRKLCQSPGLKNASQRSTWSSHVLCGGPVPPSQMKKLTFREVKQFTCRQHNQEVYLAAFIPHPLLMLPSSLGPEPASHLAD